jgi:2'-5' RNA ligase
MRLFLGIALPPETQQVLERFVAILHKVAPNLRWLPPDQWHVTLQFLGETDESHYSCVVQQLRAVPAVPVQITLASPGFFDRAKVFHVAVQPSKTLLRLHQEAERALLGCGFNPEARAYSPHITLARKKRDTDSSEFKHLQILMERHISTTFPSFTAKEFLLYQSFTFQTGSRYEVRERFPLM